MDRFDAGPDSDPNFHFDVDPDPNQRMPIHLHNLKFFKAYIYSSASPLFIHGKDLSDTRKDV